MITQNWLKEKFTPLIKTKDADKVGIVFFRSTLQVSRFANSQIHQHMADEDQAVYFRVLLDGRIGVASTNSLDEQNLKEAFKKALHMAHLKLETKEKKDIPSFKPAREVSGVFYEETIAAAAETRAKILKDIFNDAAGLGVKFSGNLYNGKTQIAVVSPQAQMNYHEYSLAGIKLIASARDASGYSSRVSHDINTLAAKQAADISVKKCLHGLKAKNLKAGRYDVILEPWAVAELIQWLNYIGFGAKAAFEETSFLYNKTGKKITGNKVNIYDYGLDKDTLSLPFDFEGQEKKKTFLIKNGIAGEPLADSHYSKILKIRPSSHANFPDDTDGPLGYNLVMHSGDTDKEKIIRSAKQAILITRFHYINGFLDTHRALMTGMTRDGTFLIEGGKMKYALSNLRFTESILEAFSRIKHISREKELIAEPLEALGSVSAPSVYIKGFNFSS